MDNMKSNSLESEPHHEVMVETGKTIQDLPEEILEEIFGHLTHTQNVIARLVCSEWNHQISSILSKKAYFALKSEEACQVILDSAVEWTKIKLPVAAHGFPISKEMKSLIQTLQMDVSTLGQLMVVLVEFPNVVHLELNIIEDKINPDDSVLEDLTMRDQFRTILKKLEVLTIESTIKNYKTFYGIIKEFGAVETMILKELKIHIIEQDDERIENESSLSLLSEIYRIISKSSRTLYFLDLNFLCESLFPELISKLCDLNELELESAWIVITWDWIWMYDFDTEEAELELLAYQKFFKTHKTGIKYMQLPMAEEPMSRELMHSISKSIEYVNSVHNGPGLSELLLLSTFTRLKTIGIYSTKIPLFDQECHSVKSCNIGQIDEMEIMEYRNHVTDGEKEKVVDFYKSLDASFVNLIQLHIDFKGFNDWHFQLIIEHVNKLKILHIESGFRISDYGVTGIDKEYSEDLMKTNKLDLCEDILKEKMIGRPLSSLKMLENLVIQKESNISDFGIYHGLRFGPILQHLTLDSKGKISDWGLHCLGAGNPGLESFEGTFKSENILDGAELLIEQFPLIKSTRKFKLVNEIPAQCDELGH